MSTHTKQTHARTHPHTRDVAKPYSVVPWEVGVRNNNNNRQLLNTHGIKNLYVGFVCRVGGERIDFLALLGQRKWAPRVHRATTENLYFHFLHNKHYKIIYNT